MRRWGMGCAIVGILAGCGSAVPGGGGGGGPAPADVTGNWRVTYHFVTNPNLATNVMGVLRLRQTGTSVVGLFQPPNGATAIPITGAVAGHLLTLTVGPVVTGPGTVMTISSQTMVDATGQTASGTVNATSLSGMTSQQLSGTADLNRQP